MPRPRSANGTCFVSRPTCFPDVPRRRTAATLANEPTEARGSARIPTSTPTWESESEVDGDHDDRSDTDTDRAARSNPTSRADYDCDGHDGRGKRDEREQYSGYENRDGRVQVVRFEEVPEQLALSSAAAEEEPEDVEFERHTGALARELGVSVEAGEVITHDTNRAISNFAAHHDVGLVLGEWHPDRWRAELLGTDVDWYMDNLPCDSMFVRDRGLGSVDRIVVIVERGPFDPLEVLAADAIAAAHGASVEFLATVDTSASADQREGLDTYLADLADLVRTGADYRVLDADERSRTDAFVDGARGADLAVVSTSAHSFVYNALFGSVPDRVIERLDCTVLVAHSQKPRRHTFLRTVLDRFVH